MRFTLSQKSGIRGMQRLTGDVVNLYNALESACSVFQVSKLFDEQGKVLQAYIEKRDLASFKSSG